MAERTWKRSFTQIGGLLFTALFLLQGCIVTYRNFPQDKIVEPPRTKEFPKAYFSVDTSSLREANLIAYLMRDQSYFKQAEKILDPALNPYPDKAIPDKGLFVRVQFLLTPVSPLRELWAISSRLTFGIIPYWSSEGGWTTGEGYMASSPYASATIRYVVYADGKELKAFEYGYSQRVINFILLAPFIWINYFTYYHDDVVTAITHQFFTDAQPVFAGLATGSGK